jgi:alanyl-tRNA synthetase
MTTAEVREKYLKFFEARGHRIIPSAPLVPKNDPTTLFTGSGMQPLIPYILGEPHPLGKRLANSQKCFRAEDIESVGDNRHTTFFEMLGNWSLGDYWKEEQLSWCFEFFTKEIGLDPQKLYVTVFAGDPAAGMPKDEESAGIWSRLFREAGIEPDGRVFYYGPEKNWWSRSGPPAAMPAGEPGGPDSEIFYEFTQVEHNKKFGEKCHPNCDCGRFMEIGNSVFMEYKKTDSGFDKLARRNVDFGGGLERIAAAANDEPDIFAIDVFAPLIAQMPAALELRKKRIIADHIRAAVFLISDGVRPSNKAGGYVLRRLLRRIIAFAYSDNIGANPEKLIQLVAEAYKGAAELDPAAIAGVYRDEYQKFLGVLESGRREFEREADKTKAQNLEFIPRAAAFGLYQSRGMTIDILEDLAKKEGVKIDRPAFEEDLKKHRELSRTASAGMFKGGLADASEKTVRLHTAHHLLLKALQIVLGPSVKQRGSNITGERLRMDFLCGKKMTEEEKREVEKIVNEKISENLPVIRSEMPIAEAEKLGAEREFGQKYPERVSVYSIGPKDAAPENPKFSEAFSIEFCGGPHVARTGEIGKFRIVKEEAVSAGVRRIRGVVE